MNVCTPPASCWSRVLVRRVPEGEPLRRYINNTEWISGCYDGSVALWTQLKKKPVNIHRQVHCHEHSEAGPGSVDADAAGWVQSVAVCPSSDLAVCSPSPPPPRSVDA